MEARTPQRQGNRANGVRWISAGVFALATVAVVPFVWNVGALFVGHLHAILDPTLRQRVFGPEYYVELALAISGVMLGALLGCLAGVWMSWRRGRFVTAAIWLGSLILITLAGRWLFL